MRHTTIRPFWFHFTRNLSLFLCAALLVLAPTVGARSIDDIKKDGKIIIATEGQFAPFNYFQGAKLTGFEVEVAEALAAKMGDRKSVV